MSESEVTLSVALVTRNRPEILRRCLQSWRSQTVAPFEIVVSDDSDPEYASNVRELAAEFACRYLSGPRRGLYANRNNVSLACWGTHIMSADDDHTHPDGFLSTVLRTILNDPGRIWIFAERQVDRPVVPLVCPAELHYSGCGQLPADPQNCAAIADGSTVYPRSVFESGLRYDETYKFGTIWYLWGQVLVQNGWRISYSAATYVHHHVDLAGRESDAAWLAEQIECTLYVQFVAAFWVKRSLISLLWAVAYLVRRTLWTDTIFGYKVRTRMPWRSVKRLLSNVRTAGRRYR